MCTHDCMQSIHRLLAVCESQSLLLRVNSGTLRDWNAKRLVTDELRSNGITHMLKPIIVV